MEGAIPHGGSEPEEWIGLALYTFGKELYKAAIVSTFPGRREKGVIPVGGGMEDASQPARKDMDGSRGFPLLGDWLPYHGMEPFSSLEQEKWMPKERCRK